MRSSLILFMASLALTRSQMDPSLCSGDLSLCFNPETGAVEKTGGPPGISPALQLQGANPPAGLGPLRTQGPQAAEGSVVVSRIIPGGPGYSQMSFLRCTPVQKVEDGSALAPDMQVPAIQRAPISAAPPICYAAPQVKPPTPQPAPLPAMPPVCYPPGHTASIPRASAGDMLGQIRSVLPNCVPPRQSIGRVECGAPAQGVLAKPDMASSIEAEKEKIRNYLRVRESIRATNIDACIQLLEDRLSALYRKKKEVSQALSNPPAPSLAASPGAAMCIPAPVPATPLASVLQHCPESKLPMGGSVGLGLSASRDSNKHLDSLIVSSSADGSLRGAKGSFLPAIFPSAPGSLMKYVREIKRDLREKHHQHARASRTEGAENKEEPESESESDEQ